MIMQLCTAVLAGCPLQLVFKENALLHEKLSLPVQDARASSTLAFVFVPMHMIGGAWQPMLPIQQLCGPDGESTSCSTAGSTGVECVLHVQGQAGPRRKLDVPNSGASQAAQG